METVSVDYLSDYICKIIVNLASLHIDILGLDLSILLIE